MHKNWIKPDLKKSIPNFTGTIINHFNGSPPESPLNEDEFNFNLDGVNKIIVFIIDALGYKSLIDIVKRSPDPSLFDNVSIHKITSVFPSTTSSALTSFYTGKFPGEHGIFGYTLFLKEYGCLSNMIELTPIFQSRDGLEKNGLDPKKFLGTDTIFQILESNGVKGCQITSKSFVNTGFTIMHSSGGSVKGTFGIGDMFHETLKKIDTIKTKGLIYCYWGLVDTFGHKYGPNSRAFYLESYSLLKMISEFCKKYLPENVGVFITADHGQIQNNYNDEINWSRRDEIYQYLYCPPGGEHRAVYLYTHEPDKVKRIIKEKYKSDLYILSREEAIKEKLFGNEVLEKYKNRIGDLIILPERKKAFCYNYNGQSHSMKGRHGGLSEKEMYIPLIYLRK